jgi:DtxR family transcriptional regulator, Mn-dependent transcriptional regulator
VRHEKELSENVEEYLETIYRITQKSPLAKTGEIARHLELSPPSVTEMTKRLQEMGYVEYEPYRGVSLTQKGRDHAARLLRRHRVVQAFLEQVLGMEKEEAHEWGCKLEHVVPVELESYLYSKLPDKDLKGLEPPLTLEESGVRPNEAPETPLAAKEAEQRRAPS